MIVEGVAEEIKSRVRSSAQNPEAIRSFRERLSRLEDKVVEECRSSLPQKYRQQIQEAIGAEGLRALDPDSLSARLAQNRRHFAGIIQRLAVLTELYRYSTAEAQKALCEVAGLQRMQAELIDSQVDHVREVEHLEDRWRQGQQAIQIMLASFEEAIKRILSFLDVEQMEVFLLDDDQFLATELKTDGKVFIYNKEEEKPALPESVHEVQIREVQEAILEMPLVVEGRQIGHCRIQRPITAGFDKAQWKTDVAWMMPVLARVIQSNHDRQLARKVYIDDLTQLNNKRKLNEQMGKLFKQFKQGQKKLYVAMIDIDRFKRLNDTYGHAVGDEILKKTAALIKEGVPNAYRYGGEEFCAVFYGHDKEATLEKMESLRRRIQETPFMISGQEYRVTISSGVAEFEVHMNSVMDAIDRADQALYASKEDGRNRCTYFEDIKGRLSADHNRLRQEILQLKEKIKELTDMEQENSVLRAALGKKKKSPSES